jgi:hypothetical protein
MLGKVMLLLQGKILGSEKYNTTLCIKSMGNPVFPGEIKLWERDQAYFSYQEC